MFSSINTCWVLVAAFLVYFMQAGFALCEAGFTRAKNTGNILMKNMMDFCIGTPCYWVIGFGLMFGGTSALIGGFDPFIQGDYSHLGLDIPLWVYIVFQTVFCATAATIVSGSMAERTNFKAYCVYSAAISLVVYPICGHWMWGGGWLQSMGFHDFAGSAAVHNVGGVIALVGIVVLPITSGDTALRGLRLTVAETLHIDQSTKGKRLSLSAVIFALVAVILVFAKFNNEGFQILWRYFAWSNQTLSLFAFLAITVWMFENGKGKYAWMPMIPGGFYCFICSTYIANAKIGFNIPWTYAYIIGVVAAVLYVGVIIWYGRKRTNAHTLQH